MGWFGTLYHLERVDARMRGGLAGLRNYLRGEADSSRTLMVASREFEAVHGHKPRYLKEVSYGH